LWLLCVLSSVGIVHRWLTGHRLWLSVLSTLWHWWHLLRSVALWILRYRLRIVGWLWLLNYRLLCGLLLRIVVLTGTRLTLLSGRLWLRCLSSWIELWVLIV
jgi:hypothetical protein